MVEKGYREISDTRSNAAAANILATFFLHLYFLLPIHQFHADDGTEYNDNKQHDGYRRTISKSAGSFKGYIIKVPYNVRQERFGPPTEAEPMPLPLKRRFGSSNI